MLLLMVLLLQRLLVPQAIFLQLAGKNLKEVWEFV